MRTITIDGLTKLGKGTFADVYRLSRRKVVKVFRRYVPRRTQRRMTDDDILMFVFDEICGVEFFRSKGANPLPVDEVVVVDLGLGDYTLGCIKRYVMCKVRYDDDFCVTFDSISANYKKTPAGEIFRIDTGTVRSFDHVDGKTVHSDPGIY